MKTYAIKFKEYDKQNIFKFIEEKSLEIEFLSPILPILYVKLSPEIKSQFENMFDLIYITEETYGELQEVEGRLNSFSKDSVKLFPAISPNKLRLIAATGWGTSIAVLDSGVDAKWINEEFDYTGFGNATYINHGTLVASIIKYFSPGSKIMSYKVSQEGKIKATVFLQALVDAVNSASIINMSLGFSIKSCTKENPCSICEHINYFASNNNIIFVSAAGNSGLEDSVDCPGKALESITVGAIDHVDMTKLANYSSKGKPNGMKPNILTSGAVIVEGVDNSNANFGTSFSTPVVSGVVGALSTFKLSPSKVKMLLYSTAKKVNLPEHHQGFGVLDIDSLVEVFINEQSDNKGQGQKSN